MSLEYETEIVDSWQLLPSPPQIPQSSSTALPLQSPLQSVLSEEYVQYEQPGVVASEL